MIKVGDKVKMEDGTEGVVMHVTPAINEECDHDWEYEEDDGQQTPTVCKKCGLSFTCYMFCCMP
jgi:hypothetical protein